MGGILTDSTNVVIGLIVAIVLICSALIPIAIGQIETLTKNYGGEDGFDITPYTDLIGVVIILAILGLVIGVVRTYTRNNESD